MNKLLLIFTLFFTFSFASYAQSPEEAAKLTAEKAAKEASIVQMEADIIAAKEAIVAITAKLQKALKWSYGSGGLLGLDINNFNNWAPKPDLNSSAQSISFSYNGFVNLIEDKYFWRNTGGINLGWVKYDNDATTSGDNDGLNQVADIFNIQSLFGYNIVKNIAASVMGEYRTTLLSNFNNPGFLDIGAGFTYTPQPNFVVVLHPLNYNFIFADDDAAFKSSLGAKLVADYNTQLWGDLLTWRSNFSAFLSYEGSELSNYTWINGLNFAAYKGIGIGFEFGLRWNPQETAARELASDRQLYYQLGVSYTL